MKRRPHSSSRTAGRRVSARRAFGGLAGSSSSIVAVMVGRGSRDQVASMMRDRGAPGRSGTAARGWRRSALRVLVRGGVEDALQGRLQRVQVLVDVRTLVGPVADAE